ncbi:hypothetical protein CPU12_04990 [Malaciobacter molluscorum LMG 25693]|uniref:Uncharacterized protein n=1 Tax=Malaciobacter molluscorum LMG 25693 TaxID=870501 RepID=A0A2G1DJG0_9BACT|nr:hypothetical protein CPU12_04990 [Malaciobacter molluscorum LMG 25693]
MFVRLSSSLFNEFLSLIFFSTISFILGVILISIFSFLSICCFFKLVETNIYVIKDITINVKSVISI